MKYTLLLALTLLSYCSAMSRLPFTRAFPDADDIVALRPFSGFGGPNLFDKQYCTSGTSIQYVPRPGGILDTLIFDNDILCIDDLSGEIGWRFANGSYYYGPNGTFIELSGPGVCFGDLPGRQDTVDQAAANFEFTSRTFRFLNNRDFENIWEYYGDYQDPGACNTGVQITYGVDRKGRIRSGQGGQLFPGVALAQGLLSTDNSKVKFSLNYDKVFNPGDPEYIEPSAFAGICGPTNVQAPYCPTLFQGFGADLQSANIRLPFTYTLPGSMTSLGNDRRGCMAA